MEEKLRKLRKISGYTQEELAIKINVSRQTISNWERGYSIPDTENLKIISKFYDVSISYFMGSDGERLYSFQKENNPINHQNFYFLSLVATASLFTPLASFVLIYLTLEFKPQLKLSTYRNFLYLGIFLSILNVVVILMVGTHLLFSLETTT
ncbi:MAG: helix-turn-helix domain-containing protein [Enterococcus sp.]